MHGLHGRLKFFDYMQRYFKRHFIVDSDVFLAFKGILPIISNKSYFGIVVFFYPFSKEVADSLPTFLKRLGFALGLLWGVDCDITFSTMKSVRHPSIPSWSWISLKFSRPRLLTLDSDLSTARNIIGLA